MKRKRILNSIIEWSKCLVGALAFAFVVNNALVVNAEVVSPSMESTIMTDSRIIGSRLAYLTDEPQRFDIIVFKFPDDESSDPFVKRIIGLPNEKVEIKDGKVFINDSTTPLDDSFINEATGGNYGPYFVPSGSYFVLGDNRNNSVDSRAWNNKFVAKEKILAKILVEYFPKIKVFN